MSPLRSFLVAIALALAVAFIVAPAASARVSAEHFAAQPSAFAPAVSPSGRYIAIPKRRPDKTVAITVVDLDAPAGTGAHTSVLPEKIYFESVDWGNEDRLLVSFHTLTSDNRRIYRIVALDRDGNNMQVLFNNLRHMKYRADLSTIVHPLPDDPQNVLIAAYDTSDKLALFKVDVGTGKAELMERGKSNTIKWLTDLKGVARARWDYNERSDTMEIYLRQGGGDDWVFVTKYGTDDFPDLSFVGFGDDPRVAIVASRQSSDRFGMFEYDTVSRTLGKPVFQHPSVDVGDPVGGPLYDPYNTKLLGVYYVEDLMEHHFFEPDLARVQAKLAATLSDASSISLLSWSVDRARFVVESMGPRDPGTYYLYDTKKDALTKISTRYPGLPSSELGEVLIIKFKARDGTRIPGYLTMPPGKGTKKLPLVVMPHGGPELRDYVTYDEWAQMLANAGYAVLQPNFRGSGGYGQAFTAAGHRQWGRLMQDDVTDGVKALVADGTADPSRICIVGASYGGYAALAGGAFTPDLYKCVVSIAGVGDLPEFVTDRGREFTTDSWSYKIWVERVGDPRVDIELMKAASPAFNATKFKVPVLLIHGDKDDIVPIEQSRRMDKALRDAGKPVEFITIDGEGHHFAAEESDIRVMKEIDRFLATHIGPN